MFTIYLSQFSHTNLPPRFISIYNPLQGTTLAIFSSIRSFVFIVNSILWKNFKAGSAHVSFEFLMYINSWGYQDNISAGIQSHKTKSILYPKDSYSRSLSDNYNDWHNIFQTVKINDEKNENDDNIMTVKVCLLI